MRTPNLKSLSLAVPKISVPYIKNLGVVRHLRFDPRWVLTIPPTEHRLVKIECSFLNCRTLGAPLDRWISELGNHSCTCLQQMRGQTSVLYAIVLNLGFFASFLNQSARSARVVEKRRKILHFMTPCAKQGRAGGEVCRDYSCHTLVLSIGIIFTRRQ